MVISEKALQFLDENARRNDRDWFTANKEHYRELVEAPMLAVAEALGPTISRIDSMLEVEPRRTLSRIRRDTRFARDKSLFRNSVWIAFKKESGLSHPVFFFEFCPDFHRYGCGYYATPAKVMECIRQRILADDPGFQRAQAALSALPHFSIDGDMYKRPKYADRSPELREWLERKSVTAMHTSTDRNLLFADDLAERLANTFAQLAPVYHFLVACHIEAMENAGSGRW